MSYNTKKAIVFCTDCGAPQSGKNYNSGEEFSCWRCGKKLWVEVFPALYRVLDPGRTGESLSDDTEASCYYHPHKRAAALCAGCGRFICSLCETELAGKCLCPPCIDKGRCNDEMELLVTHRSLHDRTALALSGLPLFFFPLTVITAPIAIYFVISHWKKPGSIIQRTKLRFVFAILIASLQVIGWLALLVIALL